MHFRTCLILSFAFLTVGVEAGTTTLGKLLIETRCGFNDDKEIVKLNKKLDYADEKLPKVSEQEEAYLAKEDTEAGDRVMFLIMNPQLPGKEEALERTKKLYARPHYHLWQTRKALAEARALASKILSGGTEPYGPAMPDANKLDRAQHAAFYVTAFALQLAQLSVRDDLTKGGIIPSKSGLGPDSELAAIIPGFMMCKAAKSIIR